MSMYELKTDDPNDSDEAWLRGYFGIAPDADKGKVVQPKRRRKNVDFLRLRDVALHALAPAPGMKLLDIGCANGPTMVYCGLQGATVFGVDLDPKHVATANEFMRRYKVKGEAICADASKLDFPDNTFDGVIASDFVEHITDDVKVAVLSEVRRVLKPGARAVIKTPNLTYLTASLRFRQAKALLRLEDPRKYVIPHTPGTDDPQHIGLATRWTLRDCAVKAGFLNYRWLYAPLRRFGTSKLVEVLSTEVPYLRDTLCEELFMVAYKPIVLSHFPD
ncbi:MAG: class I SAM-dependent methyltransferase [Myxococcales bacterium]|nr:class I SAM-dependent methyltransferase [Myxococcales bacterium]